MVPDRLAGRPADLGQTLGGGRGEDDVGTAQSETPVELRQRRKPGAAGEHDCPGAHRPAWRRRTCGRSAFQTRHRRRLEDPRSLPEHDTTQATRESGRLHGRLGGREHAAARVRKPDALGDLRCGELHDPIAEPQPAHGLEPAAPGVVLGRRGGEPEVAAARVPGVDTVALAPGADFRHAVEGRLEQLDGSFLAEPRDELLQSPEASAEAAVAPARPTAADVALDHDDVEARLELEQAMRGPQPGVAAADDQDVRSDVPPQRRARLAQVRGERLEQPPRAAGVGRSLGPHGAGGPDEIRPLRDPAGEHGNDPRARTTMTVTPASASSSRRRTRARRRRSSGDTSSRGRGRRRRPARARARPRPT